MSVTLKIWENPRKPGDVRVYANAFRERGVFAYLDRVFFHRGENGETRVSFPPNYSGNIGSAAYALERSMQTKGLPFDVFLDRLSDCVTKGGNISTDRYAKQFGWEEETWA